MNPLAAGKLQKDGLTGNGRVTVPNREKPQDRARECCAVVKNRSLRSSKLRWYCRIAAQGLRRRRSLFACPAFQQSYKDPRALLMEPRNVPGS
jgi:hypothetical protein